MTTIPPVALNVSVPLSDTDKKKRILLICTSRHQQDLRAETMRKLGADVDCAADIEEARSWWRADFYDLVLIDTSRGLEHSESFCHDVRSATPSQHLAFLVGAPAYLAATPTVEPALLPQNGNGKDSVEVVLASLPADPGEQRQRWGLLEASRRISAVRAASLARMRAIQDRPAPKRDYGAKESRRSMASASTTSASSLDDLLREGMK